MVNTTTPPFFTASVYSNVSSTCMLTTLLILSFPVAAAGNEELKNGSARDLEAITVMGTRERAYRDAVAPTANKSDTLVKETPFSIQTVTRELIEDRGVTTFGEAARTVPGVTPQVGWGVVMIVFACVALLPRRT